MARPSLSTRMARSAISALVAAVEIYNKPTVEYREQTFAVLLVNAWEVLLKARIVQQNSNRIESIAQRKEGSRYFQVDSVTKGRPTIGIESALGIVDIPGEVAENVREVLHIRNEAVHMGILHPHLAAQVLSFGTASVHNFVRLCLKWFGEPISIPYLLPVGFVGEAQLARTAINVKQGQLLKRLEEVSAGAGDSEGDFAVSLSVDVRLNRRMGGGGVIGPTHDPNAPRVNVTTDELKDMYPHSYRDLAAMCKARYGDFKANQKFNDIIRDEVKPEANCANFRPFTVRNPQAGSYSYNGDEAFKVLDRHYTLR